MFLSLGASAQYCHSVVSIETFNNCYQLHQTCERRYLSFPFPEILRVYGIFLFSPPHIGRFVCFQTFIFCTSLHLPGGGVLKLLYTPGWLCFVMRILSLKLWLMEYEIDGC
jgi:hypothetical protein